jgi:hypothetical protein
MDNFGDFFEEEESCDVCFATQFEKDEAGVIVCKFCRHQKKVI